jgi:hypothetical protein
VVLEQEARAQQVVQEEAEQARLAAEAAVVVLEA